MKVFLTSFYRSLPELINKTEITSHKIERRSNGFCFRDQQVLALGMREQVKRTMCSRISRPRHSSRTDPWELTDLPGLNHHVREAGKRTRSRAVRRRGASLEVARHRGGLGIGVCLAALMNRGAAISVSPHAPQETSRP